MRTALLIAAKDLRQRLRDRSAILIAVVAPLGLAFIFAGLLGNQSSFHAAYVVADLDGGRLAQILRRDVIGAMADAGVATVSDVVSADDARAAVADGKADTAFIIPAGFTSDIEAGRAVTLTLVGARQAGLETAIAQSLASRFGDGVVTAELAVATTAKVSGGALPADRAQSIAGEASSAVPPVSMAASTAALRQLSLPTYFSASMAVMFLFLASTFGIVSVFDERRRGTLARVLAGPVRPGDVLIGKTIAGIASGLIAMAVLVVATTLLIKADWGPPVGVALLALGAILATTGISTFVASFLRTAEAAGSATSAVAITLSILGGSFYPVNQAPDVMATLTLFTPQGWFMRGLGDLHGTGAAWTDALLPAAVLVAIGAVFGGLGLLRARKLVTVQ
jgi:ABC-2 type transport system permease protein